MDLEDISLLAKGLKCLTESTFVDARHIRPLLLTLIVDATFPAFVEINQTRVLIIEFEELPLYFSHRKSHLSDNSNFQFKVITYVDAFLFFIMTSFLKGSIH